MELRPKMNMFFLITILCNFLFSINAQNDLCVTPNGENALCVSIYSCPVLYDVVTTKNPTVIRFLKESRCGFDQNPRVCCGSFSTYQTPPTSSTERSSMPNRNILQVNDLLPTRDVCGLQLADKVLGGQQTTPEEYPWMCLLNYEKASGTGTIFSCGGVLISKRYVLTAAHCVTGEITQKVGKLANVRLGEWDISTQDDCWEDDMTGCSDPPVDVAIETAIPHPQYNQNVRSRYHDVALIRLAQEVTFSDYIKPICLPLDTNEQSPLGQKLYVAGWGKTENSSFSDVKLKVGVPIVEDTQCAQIYKAAGVTLKETQMCAGGENGKDSCNGDSGGPLMARRSSNKNQWYAEGIISFGAACGSTKWPGIYTRTSHYLGWIQDNIKP